MSLEEEIALTQQELQPLITKVGWHLALAIFATFFFGLGWW
jgi:hypothetical protein